MKKSDISLLIFLLNFLSLSGAGATPSTLIWAPSSDIQPYKKVHLTADTYSPTTSKGTNADNYDQHNYVLQVYGLTASLLSDKPEENILGKAWSPLGKIMAEAGFDYKKGLGSYYDTFPWYLHFKAGVQEDSYFKGMPQFAIGCYDMGSKRHKTDYNVWYLRGAKTLNIGKINLGRFSAGYFNGNPKLLRDKNGLRDNIGAMFAWERTISEISDRLWLCVDYQSTQSAYGSLNFGLAWKFTPNISAILGYDIYNNRNLTDTITFQLDVDF